MISEVFQGNTQFRLENQNKNFELDTSIITGCKKSHQGENKPS